MGIAWSTELMNFVFIFCSIITSKKHFLHAETVSSQCYLSPHLMMHALSVTQWTRPARMSAPQSPVEVSDTKEWLDPGPLCE